MDKTDWFFPYPADPAERFGFILGDVIAVAVLALIILPPLIALMR
jgi:hypothetical protein